MSAPTPADGLPPVEVDPAIDASDVAGVRCFYVDSTVQPFCYEPETPAYAKLVVDAVASFNPTSVLEFGCGSGRNLALLRERSPARLAGIDINPTAIAWGCKNFGLDLRVGDDASLSALGSDAFDIVYTVSVIDHIPLPAATVAALVSAAADLVVIYEIVHSGNGRVVRMADKTGSLVDGYPFSYFHDYPRLFAAAGAWLIADLAAPAEATGLMPYYRLQIYSKRPEWQRQNLIHTLALRRPAR